MVYSIEAELMSKSFEYALGVTIIKGNNLNLFTTIPKKNKREVSFNQNDALTLSYFFGDFQYHFKIEYVEIDEDERLMMFIINEVSIEKNMRKRKREIVDLNALILDSKGMYYGTILDLSESGMKIETATPILKKKIEVHFSNEFGTELKKGKVVWEKKGSEKYYYGIKLS